MTIGGWVLFPVILGAVVLVAYLGIKASSSVDLVLVAGEVAVIAALAITILVKFGPAHYSIAVRSPASSPSGQLADITDAMIYAITAACGPHESLRWRPVADSIMPARRWPSGQRRATASILSAGIRR